MSTNLSTETVSHTPGPWTQVPNFGGVRILGSNGQHGVTIVPLSLSAEPIGDFDPRKFNGQQLANAHLIAAAPDLLALAKQYAEECATCGGCGECDLPVDGCDDELESVDCIDCADIRAVIAKAEGRV